MKPQIGDILAVRGVKWYSTAICWATRGEVSHVGLVVADDPPLVMEALKRVTTRPFEQSIAESSIAYLIKPNVDRETRRRIVRAMSQSSAVSYNYWHIVLLGLDLLLRTQLFTNNYRPGKRTICSVDVANAYASVGRRFGEPARGVTPQEILSYARANPKQFSIEKVL